MRTMTATEAARNFSRILDMLEHGLSEEIVILRNNHAVATMVPGAPHMTALEALSDLHRTLDDADGESWLRDIKTLDEVASGEMRDPWA